MTLVIPARDEAARVERLLASVERLDYPPERLCTVLVDDASQDGTADVLARWADTRPRAILIRLPQRLGKWGAVKRGLADAPSSEVLAICDADVQPRSDCLRTLVQAFADRSVAIAAAYRSPENADASPIAGYAAVESWVTQLVASAAKDRLDLNPPDPGGFSAYRLEALERAGGFGSHPGQDTRLTVALTVGGWRSRFVPSAIADSTVVHTWNGYWHQHVRWARNLFASASGRRRSPGSAPLQRRIEAWMVSAGYADRLVLVAGLWLAAARRLPVALPACYLGVVACETAVALVKAGRIRQAPRFLLLTAAIFPLDITASAAATVQHLLRRPRSWRRPERENSRGTAARARRRRRQ